MPDLTSSSAPGGNRGPRTLRGFFLLLRSNWLTSFGAALALFSLLAELTALYLQSTTGWGGPYAGIFIAAILPLGFLVGLVMIPAGLLLYRHRLHERLAELSGRPTYLARAVVLITFLNIVAIAVPGSLGASHMSSNSFCGTACHEVMEPEHVAFMDSPHANIQCVDCHVGPGLKSQIAAKMNGTHQLIGVLTDTWQRPIPTPVHQLRPATETCEECHWPEKYLGTKLVSYTRFREDETNSAYTDLLLMRTGGTGPDGKPTGIHWHTNPQNKVEYIATDEKRMAIPWVKVTRPDGTVDIYTQGDLPAAPAPNGELRTMDCNDCHNRAAHDFDRLADALDRDMAAGLISRRIPSIRRVGRELLEKGMARDEAEAQIWQGLVDTYGAGGELDASMRPLLEQASAQLTRIYLRNVYPHRKLGWDAYPSLKAHVGCYRCHDGEHRSQDGLVITNRCDVCHVVLSHEQENPPILEALGLRRKEGGNGEGNSGR